MSLRRPRSIATPTRWPPRRAFSITAHLRNNLFDYTPGRWIINDALRHAERRRVFNVDGLRRLAAQSVDRSPDDIVDLKKLAEGGSNRTFLINMRGSFQMAARIPYPVTIPKYFTVAGEMATMALLRSSGLPIPTDTRLRRTTRQRPREDDIISITRHLVELESKMMSIAFPAGGSLYYTKDLEKVAGRPGIPLEDEGFCVGPDTRLPLWYGRRSQLDVDRGPYECAEAALVKGANKELVYMKQFGRPLLPFQCVRRKGYQYQEQPPSDHIENLDHYLLIASSLIPRNQTLDHFRICHPDLQPNNIIVDSNLHVVGLIDWQHTPILPLFLLAGIPGRLQNYDDPFSRSMTRPSLPESLDDLDEELYRRRLVHYHYVKNTEEYNELHYAALTDPMGMLRHRLFRYAKVALINATENWETPTGGGAPCPVVFDAEDVRETMKLDEVQRGADKALEACRNIIGLGPEGWVPTEHYEEAMTRSQQMKEYALAAATSAEERAELVGHWPFDDMDEEQYMNRAGYSEVLYLICCIYDRLVPRKNPYSFTSPSHPVPRRREVISAILLA